MTPDDVELLKMTRALEWVATVESEAGLPKAERDALMLAGPTHVRIIVKLLKELRSELNYLWGLHPDGRPKDRPWVYDDEADAGASTLDIRPEDPTAIVAPLTPEPSGG